MVTPAARRQAAGFLQADFEVSDARKLKALEEENRRLKHIVADLTLDVQMLKAVNAKKW